MASALAWVTEAFEHKDDGSGYEDPDGCDGDR